MTDIVGRIRHLVAMAASGDTPEARNAAVMARRQVAQLDTELLDTLAGQRARLLGELRAENDRLMSTHERATKAETGDLVQSAMFLLGHYERIDALLPAVLLLRVEGGHQLTNEERQQLDGPREDFLAQWLRTTRERKAAERAERRKASRARRAGAA